MALPLLFIGFGTVLVGLGSIGLARVTNIDRFLSAGMVGLIYSVVAFNMFGLLSQTASARLSSDAVSQNLLFFGIAAGSVLGLVLFPVLLGSSLRRKHRTAKDRGARFAGLELIVAAIPIPFVRGFVAIAAFALLAVVFLSEYRRMAKAPAGV